jgi:hypothetical protein
MMAGDKWGCEEERRLMSSKIVLTAPSSCALYLARFFLHPLRPTALTLATLVDSS